MRFTEEGVEAVPGFWNLGKHVGVKKDKTDFGVLYSETPCTAAGVFTQNKVVGAPVRVSKDYLNFPNARPQAIAIVSGNANVGTGKQGIQDAKAICKTVADELGLKEEQVLNASTGVIGRLLPMDKIKRGITGLKEELGKTDAFEIAILTTDTFPKKACIRGTNFTIAGVAKGAGMINPNMATTLCFVATDAKISTMALQTALKNGVDESFNQVNVDMDTSTSDMCLVLANGQAGSVDEDEFFEALGTVLKHLARKVAEDGEGASKRIQVIVTGAKTLEDARKVSKCVAGSNLFKCAIFGGDPNWGRVLAAVGNAGVDLSEKTVSIRLGGVPVFQKGEPVDFSEEDLRTKLTESTEVTVEVDLCSGAFSATSLGCDMTYKYVEINSEYTSREHAVQKKAKTILDAFEYARAFSGKTMVLKIGGKAIDNQVSEESFFQDVAILKSLGIQVVLVHGGGPFLDREMEKANLQKQTVDGLRVTTPEIMALAEKVFARINKNCVNILKKNGVDAVDATTGLMQAHVWDPRLGRVGRIESVDAPLLSKLLAEGKVPVISSIGYTPKSMPLNLNADTVAAAVAIALRAEKLTILTDVDGVLIAGKQVSSMGADEMRRYVKQGAITEGMVPKIEACLDASINGVKKAHLINGTKDHSVLLEVFTRAGLGTEILA